MENATLRSVLALMLKRGDLDREKRGKAFYYFPKKEKTTAVSDMLSGLARLFGGGSRVGLLSQLLQEDSLTDEEIRQLQELAQSSDRSHPQSTPRHPVRNDPRGTGAGTEGARVCLA